MIGDRIKELREKQGLTQKQLSEDPCLDLNINTLASYERNLREPKIDMIIRLARYFGVTTDYLLGVSEYKDYNNEKIAKQLPLSEKAIVELKRMLGKSDGNEAMQNINAVLESGKAEKFFKMFAQLIKE